MPEQTLAMLVDKSDKLTEMHKHLVFRLKDRMEIGLKPGLNLPCWGTEELKLLERLLNASFWKDYPEPVAVDVFKALRLLKDKTEAEPTFVNQVLYEARFSFFGTDGIRGKVSLEDENPLTAFCLNNELTPSLVHLAGRALARLCLEHGLIQERDALKVYVASDGRDQITGWRLYTALQTGFRQEGFKVTDLGILPTPYLPWLMLKDSVALGAVLTASHNPANQNGIKFFFNGKKILPEGLPGDYSLAAYILELASREFLNPSQPQTSEISISGFKGEVAEVCKDETIAVLPRDLAQVLKGAQIVLDSANGAFFDLAARILNGLQINWQTVNPKATGENINAFCGVAELEGRRSFSHQQKEHPPAVVERLFSLQGQGNGCLLGIALDGDGDRGFLLVYDHLKDDVLVLDGDSLGIILASHYPLLLREAGLVAGNHYVLTVESDLMVARYLRKHFGLAVAIVSVGDKWLSHYQAGPLLLGEEVSGHLVLPLAITSSNGQSFTLKTGNGLISTLLGAYLICKQNLSLEVLRNLYPAGHNKSYPVYFVTKELFYRGSEVWQKDCEIISAFYTESTRQGLLPERLTLCFEQKEDPNLLYAAFYLDEEQEAAIFCRNSGTEDKNVVYLQCPVQQARQFEACIQRLLAYKRQALKNVRRPEYRLEQAIVNLLAQEGLSEEDLFNKLNINTTNHNLADYKSVLYALKKEGRLKLENGLWYLQD